jgi:hypothetical protein
MEFEPIYPPGFHEVDLKDIDDIFVIPFENNERRRYLTERLKSYLEKFYELGIKAEIWLDGSYSTKKPEPGDIDILIVFNEQELNQIAQEKQIVLNELFNRDFCKIRYSIDVLLCPASDQNNRSYWRGWFGFSRSEVPKGIPRLNYGIN